MSLRAKQKRRQHAAIRRLAENPLSAWSMIRERGLVGWKLFRVMAEELHAEEERIIMNGTGRA